MTESLVSRQKDPRWGEQTGHWAVGHCGERHFPPMRRTYQRFRTAHWSGRSTTAVLRLLTHCGSVLYFVLRTMESCGAAADFHPRPRSITRTVQYGVLKVSSYGGPEGDSQGCNRGCGWTRNRGPARAMMNVGSAAVSTHHHGHNIVQ
jgi:hypothetical protein